MKNRFVVAAALLALSPTTMLPVMASRCTGQKNCHACHTCEYCRWCNTAGNKPCGIKTGEAAVYTHASRHVRMSRHHRVK